MCFFAAGATLICIRSACRRSAVSSMRPQAARAVKGNKPRGWITPITSQLSERAESCLRNIGALSRSLFRATLTLPRVLCNVFSASAPLPLNFVFFSYTCVNTRQWLPCEGSLSHLAPARTFCGRKISIVVDYTQHSPPLVWPRRNAIFACAVRSFLSLAHALTSSADGIHDAGLKFLLSPPRATLGQLCRWLLKNL